MATGKKFTGESTKRIAKVVRQVEAMPVDLSVPPSGPRSVVPVMTRLVEIDSSDHHLPGASATDALLAAWDSDAGDYAGDQQKPVEFGDEFRVGLGRDDAIAIVAKRPGDSRWNVVAGRFYRWCDAVVSTEITAVSGTTPGSGQATIKWLDGQAMADGPTLAVRNYQFAMAIAVDLKIEIAYQPFEDTWWVRRIHQVATTIKAAVNEGGNVAAGDANFDVDGVQIIAPLGAADYPGGSAPTNVENTWGVPSENNDVVIAWYDFADSVWHGLPHIYTTACP